MSEPPQIGAALVLRHARRGGPALGRHRRARVRADEGADRPLLGVYGVEGPGWLLPELERAWADEASRERLLWVAKAAETEAHLIAVSPHLLAVGRSRRT